MVEAIDPQAIPGSGVDPDKIDKWAGEIRGIAEKVRENGSNLQFAWQRLGGVYEAPESAAVLGLMAPVSAQSTAIGDNLRTVSAALERFADEVRPIKATLKSLRSDAEAFRASIAHGVRVTEPGPVYTSPGAEFALTHAAHSIPGYRTVTRQWQEVQEYVDRNNDLVARVNAQQIALWDAERRCASTIRGLFGGRPLRALGTGDDRFGYGLSELPDDASLPWGGTVNRTGAAARRR